MRLAEPGIGTAGLGKVVLVGLEEAAQRLLGRGRRLARQLFHDDGHDLHHGLLLEPTEVVPPPAGRIGRKTRLEQHQHVAGGQFGPQRRKEIVLRHGHRPEPQAGNDLVELFLPHQVARPLTEKVVDGRVADHDPVGLRLLREEQVANHLLLRLRKQRQAGGVAAGRGGALREEPVDDRPHGQGPLQAPLTELSARPSRHQGVAAGDASPHLEKRGQHEKGEHRQNRHKHQQGPLILAKDVERAGHGTACSRTAEPSRLDKEREGRVTLDFAGQAADCSAAPICANPDASRTAPADQFPRSSPLRYLAWPRKHRPRNAAARPASPW